MTALCIVLGILVLLLLLALAPVACGPLITGTFASR